VVNDTYFEILVYSCNQDSFVAKVTAEVEKNMASVPYRGTDIWNRIREEEIQRHLKPVRYNEIVGAVEVHTVGSQLRADYWFSDKSRIVVGSRAKGVIKWRGKLIEKWYDDSGLSSLEIFDDFRAALGEQVRGHPRLKNRFVDFEALDRGGPLVDWRKALGLP